MLHYGYSNLQIRWEKTGWDRLKYPTSLEKLVQRTVGAGSAGQGVMQDNSDADPILLLNWFSSYEDQRERSACVIDSLKQGVIQEERNLAYKVNILSSEAKEGPPCSLLLTLQSKNKKESVEVNILPAFEVLGQITLTYKPPPNALCGFDPGQLANPMRVLYFFHRPEELCEAVP
uniref:Uncharacterized protein n=1 Tax=Sphaerodactylus townsendi TaxID=933632 RepID=A0ACB8EIK8_9SAUR